MELALVVQSGVKGSNSSFYVNLIFDLIKRDIFGNMITPQQISSATHRMY